MGWTQVEWFGLGFMAGLILGCVQLSQARRVRFEIAEMLAVLQRAVATNEQKLRYWNDAKRQAEITLARAEFLRQQAEGRMIRVS